jgi:hypothetical protein
MGYAERNRSWGEWYCYSEHRICDYLGWGYGEDCDFILEECMLRTRLQFESDQMTCFFSRNDCIYRCSTI